jgi:hypothetical protein
MAHFAKLDENNVVVTVSVGRDDDTEMAIFARSGDVYKQTSYNTSGGVHRLGGTPFVRTMQGLATPTTLSVMRLYHRNHTTHGCWMKTLACGIRLLPCLKMQELVSLLRDTHGMKILHLGIYNQNKINPA